MFRGLHPRLRYAIPILTMPMPFSSFLRCRAFLLLQENRQSPESTNEMALHTARAPNSSGGAPVGGNNNRRQGGTSGNSGRNKGKCKAVADGGGQGSMSSPRPPAPSTPTSTPWTGMVHARPMPWRPHTPGAGVLGPRPGAPAPFAGHAAHYGTLPPVLYGTPPMTWTPGAVPAHPLYNAAPAGGSSSTPPPPPMWDQAALVYALDNLGLQQQQSAHSGGDWYLDTGDNAYGVLVRIEGRSG